MSGLLVELEPGQSPDELKKPPSLHGARLRRKVPLDSLTREMQKKLARTTRVLERRVERELRRSGLLAQIEADAEKRGEKAGPIGRGGIPLGPEREAAIERTFQFDGMEAVARLFADEEDAFRIELESVLGDSYQELFNRGGKAARLELGASGSFKLKNTAIADALQARANHLAGDLAEDVFDRMKTVIADGFYLEGRGISEVARALREEFDWLSNTRSERIARTETLSVTEEAQHTVYKASGIHFKRWITTLDGKERETHFDAHGQVQAIEDPFEVGAGQLMWPGDPDGPVEEIINCRCASQPIVEADQIFSDADVWRGDVDPDEFARDTEEPQDQLREGPSAPPPSDTEDLQFADEEPPADGGDEEKRSPWAEEPIDVGQSRLRIRDQDLRDLEKWLKAEREYERDEIGRFGSGGGGKPKPEPESGLRALSPGAQRRLSQVEAKIRRGDIESGVVLDDRGRELVSKDGDAESIPFTADDVSRMEGGTFTHNHPNSNSFSPDDVLLAGRAQLGELRAVGKDGTVYRMQSERGGVWPGESRMAPAFETTGREVKAELQERITRGEITARQANREYGHQVWTRVAPQIGLRYERDESRRRG